MARPMPELAPVTSAVWPLSSVSACTAGTTGSGRFMSA